MNLARLYDAIDRLFDRDGGERAHAPHCDSSVLHAPQACKYCDEYPEWQAYRKIARIAFTGEPARDGIAPCPTTAHRPAFTVDMWPGNRAVPHGEDA